MTLSPRYMQVVNRALAGARSFAEEMRELGIHVGTGTPPKCVTCDQAWPCNQQEGTSS